MKDFDEDESEDFSQQEFMLDLLQEKKHSGKLPSPKRGSKVKKQHFDEVNRESERSNPTKKDSFSKYQV